MHRHWGCFLVGKVINNAFFSNNVKFLNYLTLGQGYVGKVINNAFFSNNVKFLNYLTLGQGYFTKGACGRPAF